MQLGTLLIKLHTGPRAVYKAYANRQISINSTVWLAVVSTVLFCLEMIAYLVTQTDHHHYVIAFKLFIYCTVFIACCGVVGFTLFLAILCLKIPRLPDKHRMSYQDAIFINLSVWLPASVVLGIPDSVLSLYTLPKLPSGLSVNFLIAVLQLIWSLVLYFLAMRTIFGLTAVQTIRFSPLYILLSLGMTCLALL